MYRDATAADTVLIARDGRPARVPDVSRWYVLKIRSDVNVERLLDTLRTLPGVRRARVGRTIALAAVPNDPEFGQQWQLNAAASVHAVQAWDLGTGRSDVIIGIVDDGVDYTHLALGNTPLQSLSVDGATMGCGVDLDAESCGGALDLTYEWYERLAGGEWSGVVATGPSYSKVLPGEDMEFKVTARTAGTELTDTHYVTYQNCVVTVQPGTPRALRLTLSPNPARENSVFAVDIPATQHVALNVYDLSGRLVSRLVDQVLPAGTHRFDWNNRESGGGRVRSGLYFARLSTSSQERRVKLVVTE
jgi:hypothetical protein